MADKEDQKTRGSEGKQLRLRYFYKGQRVDQKPKPVMPIGAAGAAPAELNPGSSSTASVAQAPDTEEKP